MLETKAPTLFEQIGGRDAVTAAVDELYVRLLADGELGPYSANSASRRPSWTLSHH